MESKRSFITVIALLFIFFGCNNPQKSNSNAESAEESKEEVYEAHLTALNTNYTNLETTGVARFVVKDNKIHVTINVDNAPPLIEHWQHFHGFPEAGKSAECVSEAQDANNDGVLDVIETEVVSGTTMVPFNKLPVEMIIPTDTYPIADENGSYRYEAEISYEGMSKAFAEAFGGSELNLDDRVLYIHGVAPDTKLPKTTQSIGDIPAHVTLPIACGKIMKVN